MKAEINGYQLQQQIYESTSCLIFRAIRKKDQQSVILKLLNQDFPSSQALTRYKQEYKALSRLSSPRVPATYDLITSQEKPVLVLEDFQGSSLQSLLTKQHFSTPDKLYYCIEICKALADIHEQNIIHKALCPAHVLINPTTRQVKIIDFSIAAEFNREAPALKAREQLTGNLAYLSPEQSGRMNRLLDYRSDYYALGGIIYLLFTGRLPFEDSDPLELIYSHMAKQPPSPSLINEDVPEIISDICMKLLAKNSEQRYCSTRGIIHDLKLCLEQANKNQPLKRFSLAAEDHPCQLQISQKIYGRSRQVEQIRQKLQDISQGQVAIMLVSGESGIGKTTLIQEVYQPLTGFKGYFIRGKFNRYAKSIPYSAFIYAFKQLLTIILSSSKEQLAGWKTRINNTLDSNIQVLTDLLPELKLITGEPPALPELGPRENENRFRQVLKKFIHLFCQPQHPLVIFIDDLQWLDMASGQLIQSLLLDKSLGYFYLLGAYRKSEPGENHALATLLNQLKAKNVPVTNISLAPLSQGDIRHFLADSLVSKTKNVTELAELIREKTLGNPFFIKEFISELYRKNFISFDSGQKSWHWDLKKITSANITDNVINFMVAKLKALPKHTLELLKLASCAGSRFNLNTLAALSKTSPEQCYQELLPALEARLIQPLSEPELSSQVLISARLLIFKLKFLHDKVQQAAYSLLTPQQKQLIHYNLGCLLFERGNPSNEQLFEEVAHLNLGAALITNPFGIIEVIKLNIKAAAIARASSAYQASAELSRQARKLLPENSWSSHFDLTFTVYLALIQAEYLSGHFDRADNLYPVVLNHIKERKDLLELYTTKMMQANLSGDFSQAVTSGQRGLGLLAIEFPENENLAEKLFLHEHHGIKKLTALFEEKTKQAALNAKTGSKGPESSDEIKYAMKLLSYLWMPVYFLGRINTLGWLSAKMTALSLKQGNNEYSAYGYMNYAFTLYSAREDYQQANKFSRLALDLIQTYDNNEIKGKVLMLSAASGHWHRPLEAQEEIFQSAFEYSLDCGDFTTAGYSAIWLLITGFFSGKHFDQLSREAANFYQFHLEHESGHLQELFLPFSSQLLTSLSGVSSFDLKIGIAFNQDIFLTKHQHNPVALGFYYSARLYRALVLEQMQTPEQAISQCEQGNRFNPGTILIPFNNFHLCLILTGNFNQYTNEEHQKKAKSKINSLLRQMKNWSELNPGNYLHKYLLMSAESARISRENHSSVMQKYEAAISSLEQTRYKHYLALANKCYAAYLQHKGHIKIAAMYLQQALYLYQGWGFAIPVRQIKEHYARLMPLPAQTPLPIPEDNKHLPLDNHTLDKLHQALAGESSQEKLLQQLICLTAENAGADKAILILQEPDSEHWFIEAQYQLGAGQADIRVLQHESPAQDKLPLSLIEYNLRLGKDLLLANPHQQSQFSRDNYIKTHKPGSILCCALFSRGKVSGLIYLENQISSYAFTREHLTSLKLISGFSAMLLENARLSRELDLRVKSQTQALKFKAEFASLLAELSNQLTNLPADEYDREIARALAVLGNFCQLDNIYVYLSKGKILKISHSWHFKTSKLPLDINITRYKNFIRFIEEKNCFSFQSLAEIPAPAADFNQGLARYQFNSGVITCLSDKAENPGFIAFDGSTNQHSWTEPEIALLKTAAGIIACALENSQLAEKLKQTQEALVKTEHQLNQNVQLDELTGLHNRVYFHRQLTLEITRAARNQRYLSLILLDIDYFRRYNDNYDHMAGDEALVKVARCIQKLLKRSGESIARFGGEEFAIILPETDLKHAHKTATLLCKSIRRLALPHPCSDAANILTVSLGIATAKTGVQSSAEVMLSAANKALYQAKTNGRNRFAAIELESSHYAEPRQGT
ncbi:diguanylate cyclase [Thalassomonas haliotis]|uniref:Diguanylate cyclase n=1 Tax=Thalassomonas haliotis TaxID=485448 RepID=A0ABY7VH81_9GAMM|nr:diguanylate cyclase [Thalassomonas haliotis]WDE12801.1 diguanylate cyclase [Thalassomonas haliotis]